MDKKKIGLIIGFVGTIGASTILAIKSAKLQRDLDQTIDAVDRFVKKAERALMEDEFLRIVEHYEE